MKDLLHYLNEIVLLTKEEQTRIKNSFVQQEIAPNEVIIPSGRVATSVYFLANGFVKGYQLHKGKVVLDHLIEKGNFFTSLESFTEEAPSLDTFQAIGPVRLYQISKADYDHFNKDWANFQRISNHIMNSTLTCKMERIKDFQVLSAKERYLKLLHASPAIVQHVSVQDLAAYLGIEPPSLSRIRKAITF
ncbi:MAG: Crp/Fnr family transcriptional regulator [Aureispira sp.]